MLARYSDETNELELKGDKDELISFSKKILQNDTEIELYSKNLDPTPYSRFLKKIEIKITSNSYVKIWVENDTLYIEGSHKKLLIFSENIESFGEKWEKNTHIHVEYFDKHFYLSPNSTPLVITHG